MSTPFWQDLIDKIKDAINPAKPEPPPIEQQHDAPLAPDPADPHNITPPPLPDDGPYRAPGVRDERPVPDPAPGGTEPEPGTSSDGDAGASRPVPDPAPGGTEPEP